MSDIRNYIGSHKVGMRLLLFTVIAWIVVMLIVSFQTGFVRSFQIMAASALILWLPGFSTTLVFFPRHDRITDTEEQPGERSLDIVERTTMAVLLSIVISSVLVYALYVITIFFPHAQVSKLTPRNLSIAVVGFNMLTGAGALWRQKIISLRYVIPIGIFPLALYGLRLIGTAFTTRNLIVEGFGLVAILALVFVVTKFQKQRLLM